MEKELKAIAIQFAMDIDLGIIDLNVALEEIRKNKEGWIPVLEIMENLWELTSLTIDKLWLESQLQKSF